MRSDSVKTGTQQAPHRSLLNALGYTEEERMDMVCIIGEMIFTMKENGLITLCMEKVSLLMGIL